MGARSILTTENYKEAVIKAVNLGGDTDTIGAITGGIAGVYYGINGIPDKWLNVLIKYEEIYELVDRFYLSLEK